MDIFEWQTKTVEWEKGLRAQDDSLIAMPYLAPNAFLGIWETYLMNGDRDFLRENVPIMQTYEASMRRHAGPRSLITPFATMIDEFDYSLRWKPVLKNFTKAGGEAQRDFFEVPLEMVDLNAYLVELRRILALAFLELGQTSRAREMDSLARESADEINRRLWDDELKFYCDVRSNDGSSTRLRAVTGFTPLYARIVPPERKVWLLKALDDPEGFGASYPIPSIELRDADVDPNVPTYGGDSLVTSGVWMIVNALVRNGETARAARYIRGAIEMVTKDGVSSSYSYNPINAKPNMEKHVLSTQCAILNDLIFRYVVGFTPRADSLFEFNPIALDKSLGYLKCGPFRYKRKHNVLVEWTGREYIVSVNRSSLRFPKPMHVVAEFRPNGDLTLKNGVPL
jgi:hypothetical protein